jgi:ABC-type nitrate/sulfonate/bicarbonate transport system permease component
MRRWINIGRDRAFKPQIWGIAIFIIVWEIGVWVSHIEPWILPPPSRVLVSLVESFYLIVKHTKITLYESMVGFIGAIIISFILALLMDSIPVLKKALYPILIISQTIPIITVAPLFIIWFGYDLLPKIIIVGLVCFFPIAVSFIGGLESTDREMYDLLKSMGATKIQIFRILKLPGAMPSLFSGLKIAATYSIMGAVIGEWLGAKAGLGEFMRRSMHSFAVDRTFAAILVITLLSLGIFWIISLLEIHLMPWMRFAGIKNE